MLWDVFASFKNSLALVKLKINKFKAFGVDFRHLQEFLWASYANVISIIAFERCRSYYAMGLMVTKSHFTLPMFT